MCESGENIAEQLSFMEAIKLVECNPDELKLPVNSAYYDHLKSNSMAFDDMIVEEEVISIEKPMVTGNDKKAIKCLKGLKTSAALTDIEEEKADILIRRFENGEIPSKIAKSIVREIGLSHSDLIGLYHAIMNLVPDSYFEEVKENKPTVSGKKEIILSCYLCGGKQ